MKITERIWEQARRLFVPAQVAEVIAALEATDFPLIANNGGPVGSLAEDTATNTTVGITAVASANALADINNNNIDTVTYSLASDASGGAPAAIATEGQLDDLLRSLLEQGVPASTVAQALRVMPGIGRNQAYERVLALGREQP